MSFSRRIPRLPSNPELLLDYFDQLPSDDDSDSDFDGYIDESDYVDEQQLTYDGDLELASTSTSSSQNYDHAVNQPSLMPATVLPAPPLPVTTPAPPVVTATAMPAPPIVVPVTTTASPVPVATPAPPVATPSMINQ